MEGSGSSGQPCSGALAQCEPTFLFLALSQPRTITLSPLLSTPVKAVRPSDGRRLWSLRSRVGEFEPPNLAGVASVSLRSQPSGDDRIGITNRAEAVKCSVLGTMQKSTGCWLGQPAAGQNKPPAPTTIIPVGIRCILLSPAASRDPVRPGTGSGQGWLAPASEALLKLNLAATPASKIERWAGSTAKPIYESNRGNVNGSACTLGPDATIRTVKS